MHADADGRHRRARPAASALAAAEAFPQVYAAIGRHPNARDGLRRRRPRRAARARRARALRGDRRDRPRLLPRPRAARATRSAPSHAQIELARATGKPLVIHTRAAEDDTIATLARARRRASRVILHCFSMPDAPRRVPGTRGWWISFAGNVTYPKARRPRRGRRARPRRPAAGRDRRAVPDAAGGAQGAQRARVRRRTPRASSPSAAASPTRSSRPLVERNAARAVRLVSRRAARPAAEPAAAAPVRRAPQARARPELPHRLEHPRRDRARRRARARRRRARDRRRPRRALSEHLAARARARARRRGRPRARARAARRARRRSRTPRCTSPTRWRSTSRALDPPPTKVVANLPYGIAATAILRTIEELPGVDALGRDGPARGRRAARRGARDAGLRHARRCSPSSPARCASLRRGLAHGVPPGAERRLGARRAATARGRRAAPRACARSSRPRSRTGARRSRARWRCARAPAPGRARARPRGARASSATPPTCAPSAWRPRTSRALAEALAR